LLEDGESKGTRTSHDSVRERSGNTSVDRDGAEADEESSGSGRKKRKSAEQKEQKEDSDWERFEISIRSYRLVIRSATQKHQARPLAVISQMLASTLSSSRPVSERFLAGLWRFPATFPRFFGSLLRQIVASHTSLRLSLLPKSCFCFSRVRMTPPIDRFLLSARGSGKRATSPQVTPFPPSPLYPLPSLYSSFLTVKPEHK